MLRNLLYRFHQTVACRLAYDVDLVKLLDSRENRRVEEVLLAELGLDNPIHLTVGIGAFLNHVVNTLASNRMEIHHLCKLVFKSPAVRSRNAVVGPDAQQLLASTDFLEFLQVLNGIARIADNRTPTIGDDIIIGDDRVGSRMIAFRIDPPAIAEYFHLSQRHIYRKS